MRHRVRTLVLLLIIGLAGATAQPSAQIKAATNHPTPASSPAESIEYEGSLGGITSQLKLSGTLLYINEGTKLTILDVSDPEQPKRRGSVEVPDLIVDIAIDNGFAYLALGMAGLQIVDVHDPDQPVLRGAYHTSAETHMFEVEEQDDIAYIVAYFPDGSFRLQAIDVGSPDLPALRGEYQNPGGISNLKLAGDLAYLATGAQHDLQIVDVSDPAHLVKRGEYATPGWLSHISVVGSLVYAIDYAERDSLLIIDASNPSAPVLRGSYSELGAAPTDVRADGTTVYIFSPSSDGIYVIDASDPANPTLRRIYKSPAEVRNLEVSAGRAYLLLYNEILTTRLNDANDPAIHGSFVLLPDITTAQVVGDLVYTVGADSGLQIFDISDPSRPHWLGAYHGWDITRREIVRDVIVQGDFAFVATDDTLQVVDVSNPAHPVLLVDYEGVNRLSSFQIVGNLLYALGLSDDFITTNLFIFQVSHPALGPLLLSELPLPTAHAFDLEVVDEHAYIVADGGWMQVYDVSNPNIPAALGVIQLQPSYTSNQLRVVGDAAYVTGNRLQIVDVSEPTNMALRNIYTPHFYTSGIDVAGSLLYLTDAYTSELHIVDITYPFNPRPCATYRLEGGSPWGVDVADDLAFVRTQGEGLRIFRVDPAQFPPSIYAPLIAKNS